MRKALIVGINNYPGSPLFGCVNDATAVAGVMEDHENGSPNFDVKLATNVPDKPRLMGLIKELFKGECEIALFYFSGHGFINELGGYLVTPDVQLHDEGVSMEDVLKIANNSAVKHKIIILDCCHAGAMGTPTINGNIAAQLVPGVTILTASMDKEKSVEVNGHGLFTNFLLDALRGGAADLTGDITPGSMYAYIERALGPWKQRPVFKANITTFTSLRQVIPQVEINDLRKITEYFPAANHNYSLDPEYEYTHSGAKPDKVAIFKRLQKFESVGIVVPVGAEHMYWAAMNSTSCKLTNLGYHYWRLVKDRRI